MHQDVTRHGNHIILVVFTIMTGDFNVQISIRPGLVLAENDRQIYIPPRSRIQPLKISTSGEAGNGFRAFDRLVGSQVKSDLQR